MKFSYRFDQLKLSKLKYKRTETIFFLKKFLINTLTER